MKINTKFGTLYAQRGGFGYQLLDSKGFTIWDYDNDMPMRYKKELESCETEQEFFDLLNILINDEGIYWGTNKKELADLLYEEINDYETRNDIDLKTTKKFILETISSCANRIGKHYVLCGYWNYF